MQDEHKRGTLVSRPEARRRARGSSLLVPVAEAVLRVGLFDEHPIKLAGFTLGERHVTAIGRPTLEEWIAAVQFAGAIENAAGYWIGDLLRYAENRADWQGKIDQAMALTGVARQTALNLTYIARHVEEPERQLAPTISHAAAVAQLAQPEQTKWLEQARAEGLTVRELRNAVRREHRAVVLTGSAPEVRDVEVLVCVSVEAVNSTVAEDVAWKTIAALLKATPPSAPVCQARVIASHERPQ